MSSKSKLITAIVLLAVGAGLVPTGLVTDDYLQDLVYDGVPEAMLGIKDDAIPGLKEEIPVLGTPDILKGIFDEASAQVEPMLKAKLTPEVLRGFRDDAYAELPALIEPAVAVQATDQAITGAQAFYGSPAAALDGFFNDANWTTNTSGVFGFAGISEQMAGVNLSYTAYAQNTVMYTGFLDPTPGGPYFYIPGVLTDLTFGSALDTFEEIFYWIWGPYGGWPNATLQAGYNMTWTQLSSFQWYYEYYFRPFVVPAILGMSVAEYAPIAFMGQWANGTMKSDGIDLSIIKAGLPSPTMGGEAGVPTPTNISLSTCFDLWNESIPYSFTNETGFMMWLSAAAGNSTVETMLNATFGLTSAQFLLIYGWLNNFMENLTPQFLLLETGHTLSELATMAFFEQWANGTMGGEVAIPGGVLASLDASLAGAPYFEIGLPSASGLEFSLCQDLWDPLEDNTFIYGESFQSMWLPAVQGNSTSQAAIIATFGMSTGELTAILTWLGAFIGADPTTGRSADMLAYNYGQSLTQIATIAFYEQWSNGTINEEEVLPDGFLAERTPPIYGPPYFEIGLSYSATLTVAQCVALWNTNSEYSLVTVSGVNKWYQAAPGNSMYTTLQTQNGGLTIVQMSAILEWLPQFRDQIVNKLAKDDRNLPMEPYDLGQTLALSLGAGGGALAALGVVFLILSRRS